MTMFVATSERWQKLYIFETSPFNFFESTANIITVILQPKESFFCLENVKVPPETLGCQLIVLESD